MDLSSLHGDPRSAHTHYTPDSKSYLSSKGPDLYFGDSYTYASDYFGGPFLDDNLHSCSMMKPLDVFSPWDSPSPSTFPGANPTSSSPFAVSDSHLKTWPKFNSGDLAYGKYAHDAEKIETHHTADSIHTCSSSPSSPAISPQIARQSRLPSPSAYPRTFINVRSEPTRRKRGRPRLPPAASKVSVSTVAKKVERPQCIPHTEVERKYREKLNTELERLRRAVPSLLRADSDNVMGGARISKSAVLAVAIDYIKDLEAQRDSALDEVKRLGGEVKF
ncbi:hypothetical protein COCC4DRAFT_32829 [Bipolaris maydis ATCC 48331]|uniref:BHLH domain-containing protein n=2 Tax=Cochliobolus heterostrophus TaxID=5016 RepID=M2TYG2_COCH5|nr:uncharacterized protein COCC4DRAFT_32829 [Bipolaris maydis ATCC 48331]EMD86846.1 hypothetical protein COCHEDRAFT_1023669 [Bipolaris maydis C5]KAH7559906.1 hypothetical protein BM1_03540 [Bipolaris maydis]ENI04157.1 hypothetical protein COCC4DRAFT_32829 [Bipolaris maydis ATCC 48331]KAJ5055548.1 hypothetical protein J3E74DRAFT_380207 [Bipolaris maydis]KAJ6204183.1 hypothetical protein PSV09DRAFT_1023669 [Bipolaris maydis]